MIEITQGPQNVTVVEGESAVFTCSYTGTFEFPTWHINGASYAIQGETLGLPERHRYSNQMMTVRDVQASDDGTTYSCSFLFGTIASSEATLTVLSASSATQGKYVLCMQNYTLTGLTNICHRNFNDKSYEFGNLWNH